MTARTVVQSVLLALIVLSCWLGVIGMLRMREPTQALHYLGLPACIGSPLLTVAVFVATGNSSAAWKTLLICLLLLLANAVVTHAIARAFRARELGHWQPRPGDPFEYTPTLAAHRAQNASRAASALPTTPGGPA